MGDPDGLGDCFHAASNVESEPCLRAGSGDLLP